MPHSKVVSTASRSQYGTTFPPHKRSTLLRQACSHPTFATTNKFESEFVTFVRPTAGNCRANNTGFALSATIWAAAHNLDSEEHQVTRPRAIISLLLFVLLASTAALAQKTSEQKLDRLIVYGKDFSFGVKEPAGWVADTDSQAQRFHVNVVFTKEKQDSDDKTVTIRVRVNKKVDENTIEDLNYDMEQYKKEFPNAQFSPLNEVHSEYKTFGKQVYVPGQFYEYVAYLNPGPGSRYTFSVALSKKGTAATPEQLRAYDEVLKSLVWLTSSVVNK